MKKSLTILILTTISLGLWGQTVDSLGIDILLNVRESMYLNEAFSKTRADFNFEKKKIGFFVGSSNYRLWTKQEYFESVKGALKNNATMQHQLLILNEDEKVRSGGYDAFVIAWSKILVTGGHKRKLINKINGTQKE